MSSDDELSRMFSAERAEQPSGASTERGLHQLRAALRAKAGAPALAHGPLKLGLAVAVKWSAGSSLLVLALLSAGAGFSTTAPALPPQAAPAAASSSVTPSVELPTPAPSIDPQSSAPQSPSVVVAARASSQPPEASSSFKEELRLIKSATQALDAGRDQQATALLYEHARLYPNGVFQSERDALSVLLDCKHTPAAGAAAARRFVDQNSRSPLVDRISRACGLAAAPTKTNFPEVSNGK